MGLCLSSRIKSHNLRHRVKNKKAKDVKKMSKRSRKISSATQPPSDPETEGVILKSAKLKRFCFYELKAAISLNNIIGEGGFGMVFKGWIEEHSLTDSGHETGMAIAVKMLSKKSNQGQQEWLAEIKYLGQLCHPNLVKLIGYCIEDDKRLLVYEFMPKGSLESCLLKGVLYSQPLSWNHRMKIALGAAKGLEFLHEKAQVIYRDFKASNILLDENYNAKLSDFGFAKDGPVGDKSHLTASIRGSYAHLAPEYMNKGWLTTKVDVYSFGVMLLEIISGRRAIDEEWVKWTKLHISRKPKIFPILDRSIEGENALRGALKAADLAVQCLSTEPTLRPNMKEVVKALQQLFESSQS